MQYPGKITTIIRSTAKSRRPVAALLLALLLPAACASNELETSANDAPAVVAASRNTLSGDYLSGRQAQAVQDMTSAARFFTKALKLAPDSPGLLRRTFVIMAAEGRLREASQLARKLLQKKPTPAIAEIMIIVDEIKNNRLQQARDAISGLPKDSLDTVMAPLLGAWTAVGMGQPVKRALDILKPLDRDGSRAFYNLHAGLINELSGQPKAAEASLLATFGNGAGPSLRTVQLLGNLYERLGEKAKAKKLYSKHGLHNPRSPIVAPAMRRLAAGVRPPPIVASFRDGVAEALFGVASSLLQRNAGETALIFGHMALYLKPDFPVMEILLGNILQRDNRLTDANRIFRDIDPASPYALTARLRYAENLDQQRQTAEAIKLFRTIADENPKMAEPMILLGDLLRRRERFGEAVKAYGEAVRRIGKLGPQNWSLLYSSGIVLERSGQWKKAEADLLEALKFKPDQPYVLNYLGYSWVDKGINLDRGKEMIRKAVQLRPRDGYIVDSLGWAYYRLGEYRQSVKQMERAVSLQPSDPVINDHLGDAYWRVGRRDEARFQWRLVLTLGTGDDKLQASVKNKLKNGLTAKKAP